MTQKRTTIDFLVHGEPTNSNRLHGTSDEALSQDGIAQMRRSLKTILPWQKIYTSPLQRCKDFAITIGYEFRINVTQINEFTAMNMGDWQGMSILELEQSKYKDDFQEYKKSPLSCTPPNSQSFQSYLEQTKNPLQKLLSQSSDQHSLVICHSETVRAAMVHLLNFEENSTANIALPFASCTRIIIPNGSTQAYLTGHGKYFDSAL